MTPGKQFSGVLTRVACDSIAGYGPIKILLNHCDDLQHEGNGGIQICSSETVPDSGFDPTAIVSLIRNTEERRSEHPSDSGHVGVVQQVG